MLESLLLFFFTVPLLLAIFIVIMYVSMMYENLVSYFRIRYIRKHKDKIVVETEINNMTYSGIRHVSYWFAAPARRQDEYYRWSLQEDGTPGDIIALCKLRDFTKDSEHISLWFKLETIDSWFKLETIDSWFRIGRSNASMKQVKEKLQDVSDEHFIMHKMSGN